MEGEYKRIFLVLAQEEISGIRPPKGIYFVRFLSAAQEIWISEKVTEKRSNPYVLMARCRQIPVYTCRLQDGRPTIRPQKERTMEKAYEL